jgi:hypothetical protein
VDDTLRVLELNGLMSAAKQDAKNGGHDLRPFMVCHTDTFSIAKSACRRCGCTVQATVNGDGSNNVGSVFVLPCRRPAA